MRVGEALSLNLEDVDLANGVIRIRQGKFRKSRLVPMAQDLNGRMKQCRLFVERVVRQCGLRMPASSPGPKVPILKVDPAILVSKGARRG